MTTEALALADYPWIQTTLSGVFVVRGADAAGFDQVVRTAANGYRGPNFGGLDLMPPNQNQEGWVFIGRWADCWVDEIRTAATSFHQSLLSAASILNAGIEMATNAVTLTYPAPRSVEVVPWLAFWGGVAVPWWEWPAGERERLERQVYPSLPRWIAIRNGEPHWLGIGLQKDFAGVTPYAKIRFVERRGIELFGMASREEYLGWLNSLRQATRWF